MQRNLFAVSLIVLVSTFMVVTGCAKKRVPVESDAQEQKEEQTASKPKEAMEKKESKIKETDIGSSRTMPGKKDKTGKEPGGIKTVYFDYDQYNIREDMRERLESNAKWLKSHPKVSVKVEGHADERGTVEYNLALGQRRAKAIRQFLLALGIESSRLSMISFGEERPSCSKQTEGCYAENRRAKFDLGR